MRFYTGQHAYYCGVDLHAPTRIWPRKFEPV